MGPESPAHGEVGSREAARSPTWTARSRAGPGSQLEERLEREWGALANHVIVHVPPNYKVERATTQPDPFAPYRSLPPLFSPPPPFLASTRRDQDRILRPPAAAAAAYSRWTR